MFQSYQKRCFYLFLILFHIDYFLSLHLMRYLIQILLSFFGHKDTPILIKWSEQTAGDISNSISAAKNSGNLGKISEAKVAEFIQQEGISIEGYALEIKRANNTVAGDIDVLTNNALIEVKNSFGSWSGKKDQVNKFVKSLNDDFMNPYNKKVILYIEQPLSALDKSSILNYIPTNVTLVNSLNELKVVLK